MASTVSPELSVTSFQDIPRHQYDGSLPHCRTRPERQDHPPAVVMPREAALRRAGIDDFRFHDLRHTWASWLVQAGVPLSVLQEMGGWESIEMVRRYAHLAPNHLTEHARQIDSILNPSVPNLSQSKNKEGTNDV